MVAVAEFVNWVLTDIIEIKDKWYDSKKNQVEIDENLMKTNLFNKNYFGYFWGNQFQSFLRSQWNVLDVEELITFETKFIGFTRLSSISINLLEIFRII